MTRLLLVLVGFLFMSLYSYALAQSAPPTPMEQAMGDELGQNVNAKLQLKAALIAAQAHVKDLEAQLAEAKKSCPVTEGKPKE